MVGSLGRVAADIALLGGCGIGELAEAGDPGRGERPASVVALAAAQRAPQRVAALLAAMPQARAPGSWQAELAEWPQLLMSAHGSARALAGALPGLQVDAARMLSNIDRLRDALPAGSADHGLDPALAEAAGAQALAQVLALQCGPRILRSGRHCTMTAAAARRGISFALLLPLLLGGAAGRHRQLPAGTAGDHARPGRGQRQPDGLRARLRLRPAALRPAVGPVRAPPGAADRPRQLCAGGAGLCAVERDPDAGRLPGAAGLLDGGDPGLRAGRGARPLSGARRAARDGARPHRARRGGPAGAADGGLDGAVRGLALGAGRHGGVCIRALAAVLARLRRNARRQCRPVGAPRQPARSLRQRELSRLGLAGGRHLWRDLLLPAAVADGLHQLPGLLAGLVRMDPGRRLAGLHLQHHAVPSPAAAHGGGARGAAGLAAEPRRAAGAGAGLLAAAAVGLAAAAGPCDLLHRPRHPPALRPGRRGRRPAASGGARGVVVRICDDGGRLRRRPGGGRLRRSRTQPRRLADGAADGAGRRRAGADRLRLAAPAAARRILERKVHDPLEPCPRGRWPDRRPEPCAGLRPPHVGRRGGAAGAGPHGAALRPPQPRGLRVGARAGHDAGRWRTTRPR